MKDEKAKIIDRVKKLMAMAADGSSPNEAAIAARRARSLMDKHQLSIDDLKERSEFQEKGVGAKRRFTPKWEQWLAVRVAQYNDCQVRYKTTSETQHGAYKQFKFQGFDEDVQIAEFMFHYLMENGKRQCSVYMKEQGYTRYNARVGTSFKDAYATELCARLNEMTKARKQEQEQAAATGTALMVIKQDLVEKEFGVAKYGHETRNRDMDRDDMMAHRAGKEAGRNTSIHTGVTGEKRTGIK